MTLSWWENVTSCSFLLESVKEGKQASRQEGKKANECYLWFANSETKLARWHA